MEASLLLSDWFRNNRASLRDQTLESDIHPAAERRSHMLPFLDSKGGTRGQESDGGVLERLE